jgi:hypothetical protein
MTGAAIGEGTTGNAQQQAEGKQDRHNSSHRYPPFRMGLPHDCPYLYRTLFILSMEFSTRPHPGMPFFWPTAFRLTSHWEGLRWYGTPFAPTCLVSSEEWTPPPGIDVDT